MPSQGPHRFPPSQCHKTKRKYRVGKEQMGVLRIWGISVVNISLVALCKFELATGNNTFNPFLLRKKTAVAIISCNRGSAIQNRHGGDEPCMPFYYSRSCIKTVGKCCTTCGLRKNRIARGTSDIIQCVNSRKSVVKEWNMWSLGWLSSNWFIFKNMMSHWRTRSLVPAYP